MVTEKIKVSNDGTGINEALDLSDRVAASMGLEQKYSFHLRLLAEEMFSMVRAITGNFTADFWIDEENRNCKLYLEAKSELDYSKRKELISVSTRGKNIAQRGIMEKVREIIEAGLYSVEESFNLQAEYGTGMFNYGHLGTLDTGISEVIYLWSMQKYKTNVEAEREDNPEVWDELEKSIIANIADEVQVGVLKDKVTLIVEKKF